MKRIHKIMINPDCIQENGRMEVSFETCHDADDRTYQQVTRSSMKRLERLTYKYRVTAIIDRYPTIFIRNERK